MRTSTFGKNTLSRLACRPALPKDTHDAMELTRTIWEGEDYIPRVWLDWLWDPFGLFAVAELGGQVVGLGKLSQLSKDDWWLEGLRVHPDYERRGIASHLHQYLLEFWLKHGGGIIRLVTASYRLPIHRICERTGFQKIAEFTPFIAQTNGPDLTKETSSGFKLGEANQVGQVCKFIHTNPIKPWTGGLMDLGWQWAVPSLEHMRQAIDRGQVFWWRNQNGVIIISEDDEKPLPTMMLRMIACCKENIVEILQDYRCLSGHLGFKYAGWNAPLNSEIEAVLDLAGFLREWDTSLFVFERKHPDY